MVVNAFSNANSRLYPKAPNGEANSSYPIGRKSRGNTGKLFPKNFQNSRAPFPEVPPSSPPAR